MSIPMDTALTVPRVVEEAEEITGLCTSAHAIRETGNIADSWMKSAVTSVMGAIIGVRPTPPLESARSGPRRSLRDRAAA